MKVCPVCKSRCFDDMDVCYGCLHNFEETVDYKVDVDENNIIPEYFEMEDFSLIEENKPVLQPCTGSQHCKCNDQNIVIKLELPKSVFEKYVV